MSWITTYIILLVIGIVGTKTIFKNRALPFLTFLSLIFIGSFSLGAAILCIALTLITYIGQRSKVHAAIGIIVQVSVIALSHFGDFPTVIKIGLLFYGIQNLGWLIQSFRQQLKTNISFVNLLFNNTFWVKIFSGPILLPKEHITLNPFAEKEDYISGFQRILLGLFKKLVLADRLGIIVSTVFDHPENEPKSIAIALSAIIFTFQMYLDFSAYTDIALGSAKLFGINLKENFKLPLRSKSISEYWRKTHISLIEWFTQNIFLYINFKLRKHALIGTILGITATFFLSGIWHGFAFGFVAWGLLNAVYLIIEKISNHKFRLGIIGWPITIILISFSNLFFRAKTFDNSIFYIKRLLHFEPFDWMKDVIAIFGNGGYLEQQYNLVELFILAILYFVFEKRIEIISRSVLLKPAYILLIILGLVLFGNFAETSQFIYVQF